MTPPTPRGPLSEEVVAALTGPARPVPRLAPLAVATAKRVREAGVEAVLGDEDAQLSLTLLYEVHYRGVGGDDAWEWDPAALAARAALEEPFEAAVRHVAAPLAAAGRAALDDVAAPGADAVAAALFALVAADDGPSLSGHLQRHGTEDQVREFLVHRSAYHLKEADPHTWAIPRLSGRAKAALVEVQADEYGGGRPARMHSALFAQALRGAGLDDAYGAHLDAVPATTLATVNAMSLFGLHRRLRGAAAGHLAAVEISSSVPSRRYSTALRRLASGPDVRLFFDEHVEADAVHEQIAARDLAGGLVEAEPALLDDVLMGAAAGPALDARAARPMLAAWARGESSLRTAAAGV